MIRTIRKIPQKMRAAPGRWIDVNINNNFSSIEQIAGQYLGTRTAKPSAKDARDEGISFEAAFRQAGGLKFSKHAGERLVSRNISLTPQQLTRLEEGKRIAAEKGIRESLMIMDKMAFIVNVPNNTVVTAIDGTNSGKAGQNVFTNIDGAVIV